MTRNIYTEIEALPSDGSYMIQAEGIINYGERWAYGYIVPIRELKTSDFKRGTLFLSVADGDDNTYYFANHVDDQMGAARICREGGFEAMFDLREQRWLKI